MGRRSSRICSKTPGKRWRGRYSCGTTKQVCNYKKIVLYRVSHKMYPNFYWISSLAAIKWFSISGWLIFKWKQKVNLFGPTTLFSYSYDKIHLMTIN